MVNHAQQGREEIQLEFVAFAGSIDWLGAKRLLQLIPADYFCVGIVLGECLDPVRIAQFPVWPSKG